MSMNAAVLGAIKTEANGMESVYGVTITAYQCECGTDDCRHHMFVFRDGRWQKSFAGVGFQHIDEQTVEELRAAHKNLTPHLSRQVMSLLEQIAHWELRTLRAEAAQVKR